MLVKEIIQAIYADMFELANISMFSTRLFVESSLLEFERRRSKSQGPGATRGAAGMASWPMTSQRRFPQHLIAAPPSMNPSHIAAVVLSSGNLGSHLNTTAADTMANFRRFRPDDLNKLSKCNLDPFTETYELGFYLQYYAKWPSLFQVAEDQHGNIIGYSQSLLFFVPVQPIAGH